MAMESAQGLASGEFRLGVRISVYNATLRNALKAMEKPFYVIAKELGLHLPEFYDYLGLRRKPTIEKAARICAYIGRPIDEVFPEHLLSVPKQKPIHLEMTEREYEALRAQGGFTNPWGLEHMGTAAAGNVALEGPIREVVGSLPNESERRVITLRFGLDGGGARTVQEIADEMHVTKSRVFQIEKKALFRLRHPVRSDRLRELVVRTDRGY